MIDEQSVRRCVPGSGLAGYSVCCPRRSHGRDPAGVVGRDNPSPPELLSGAHLSSVLTPISCSGQWSSSLPASCQRANSGYRSCALRRVTLVPPATRRCEIVSAIGSNDVKTLNAVASNNALRSPTHRGPMTSEERSEPSKVQDESIGAHRRVVVTKLSPWSVADTVTRLLAVVAARGL